MYRSTALNHLAGTHLEADRFQKAIGPYLERPRESVGATAGRPTARILPAPIDAHLAALAALRLDADRLPLPRADGDR
ncbi:MAG TPA: hypothetical protein VNT27_05195, partial [Propionibacteriaceae bacterium]|nr:hypothetical protein [Propionibacteriaceae bacterium]